MNLKSIFLILTMTFSSLLQAQNRALSFQTNDFIQTTFQGPTGNASRTVEAWIKTTANCIPNAGGVQQVIVDWGTFLTGQRFTMNLLWSNALRLEVGGNGLSGTIAVNDGQWHHVAVVYNSSLSTNQYSLYVDGVLDVQGNLTVATNTGSSVNMRIGQRVDGVNTFNGEIDEVRVFDFPRTLAQIIAEKDQELCSTTSGLLAYYKLNEGLPNVSNTGNNTAKDYSGNSNDGTLTNFSLSGSSSNWINGPVLSPRTTYSSFNITECNSYTSPSGNIWNFSGIYQDTIPNVSGCDSIMTIDVQIGSVQSGQALVVFECDSYTSPSGDVYNVSSIFYDTLYNGSSSGCDSIIFVVANIGSSSNLVTSVCDSYTSPSGNVYTNSQSFSDTLLGASAAGCDSIIQIDLTVGFSDSTFENLFVCEDSVLIGNAWYSSNQNVDLVATNISGCDSTHTVILTFGLPSSSSLNVSSCGTYTSPSGQMYGSSSSFVETYTNAAGCDSVVQFNLTVFNPVTTDLSIASCDSATVNGVVYTNSQMITYVLTDVKGCDSTVNVDLTINIIDASVSLGTDNTISAVQYLGASYTWYNCETNEVVSALNNFEYTPNETGEYKVEIGHLGCVKESDCVAIMINGITAVFDENKIELSPNPNDGVFKINLEDDKFINEFEIINILGQSVSKESNLKTKTLNIAQKLEKGIYFIKIKSNQTIYLRQFLVE